ncbi:MAG: chromosome condensation regulator RCC1 [Myxococcales bacterium]|nr:MAG: chromosome condensation regulator RCC1 [Myxococcales bacterium]
MDGTPPVLVLQSPSVEQELASYELRVKGQASDETALGAVTVQVGDQAPVAVTVDGTGSFSAVLTPSRGPVVVKVQALDAAGNKTEVARTVVLGTSVTAGGSHTGALRDGALFAWGRNNLSQVGDGTALDRNTPQPIAVSKPLASLAFRQNSSVAVAVDGTAFGWGTNADGQLGLGTSATPDLVTRKTPTELPVTGVVLAVLGYNHTLLLREDGTVWAAGDNTKGQVGDPTKVGQKVSVLTPVAGLSGVVQIGAGSAFSLARKADGTVWAWGNNAYGDLGQGTVDSTAHATPVQVPGLTDIVDVSAGRDHVLALRADGTVWAWGLNKNGQLGIGVSGDGADRSSPTQLTSGVDGVVSVHGGANHSFIRMADGTLRGFGQAGSGQLGTGDTTELNVPSTPVKGLTGVSGLGFGALHVITRQPGGSYSAWGWSFKGSLGGGDALLDTWSYVEPIVVTLP